MGEVMTCRESGGGAAAFAGGAETGAIGNADVVTGATASGETASGPERMTGVGAACMTDGSLKRLTCNRKPSCSISNSAKPFSLTSSISSLISFKSIACPHHLWFKVQRSQKANRHAQVA